jgi:hypothetical protein
VRFGARDYDAVTGRWTAKDPIGFGGGTTNFTHTIWTGTLAGSVTQGYDSVFNVASMSVAGGFAATTTT